jgi:hypothetical protein
MLHKRASKLESSNRDGSMEKELLCKIIYFDRETVGNMLQQLHGGTMANVISRSIDSVTDAEADANAEVQVNLGVPVWTRIKFAFTGKLSAKYINKSSSVTTVTATDIGQFREIRDKLIEFDNRSLHDIKNSLTSFRMAAGFLNVMREGIDGVKSKELMDMLENSEGYGLYDIGEDKYVRFNSKAFVSNYKLNDVLLSKLDLYCTPVGSFDRKEFDYLKRVESIGALFTSASNNSRPLDEIYPGLTVTETAKNGQGTPSRSQASQVKLYDVVCAYIAECSLSEEG